MKIYLHIVNNRPFIYSTGKDIDEVVDLAKFIGYAERYARTTFSQSPDRCEDNVDFYAANGQSAIHVITLNNDTVRACQ